jgi:hypothetical protein
MCKLEKLTHEEIQNLPAPEMKEVIYASESNECKPGKLCDEEVFFEQINQCMLCGKLM